MTRQFNKVLDELNLIRERLERAHQQEVRSLQHEIRYLQHLSPTGGKNVIAYLGRSSLDSGSCAERGGRVNQSLSLAGHGHSPSPLGRSSRNTSDRSSRSSLAPLPAVQEEEKEEEEKHVNTDEKQDEPHMRSQEQRSSNTPNMVPGPDPVEGAAISRRSKPLGRPPRAASAQANPNAHQICVSDNNIADSLKSLGQNSSQVEKALSSYDMNAIRVSDQQHGHDADVQACNNHPEANVTPGAFLRGHTSTNTSDTPPTSVSSQPAISHPVHHTESHVTWDSDGLRHSFEIDQVSSGLSSSSRRATQSKLLSSQGSGLFHPKEPWNIDIPKFSDANSVRTFRSVWVNKVPPLTRASRQLARSLTPQISHRSLLGTGSMLINPFSTQRLVWDLFGLMLIVYDCIFIPLQLLDVEYLITEFVWVSRIFWTLDILVQCLTGVIVEQRMVVDFKEIIKNYARGWMLFDIGVVLVDWLTLAAESDDFGDAANALRTLRILRFIRLLRLVRIQRVWAEVVARINNAASILMIGIIRHIIVMMIANHIIACLWYGVGRASKSLNYEVGLHDSTVLYKYLSALHWSFTQFHGSSDINPTNEPERGFAVGMVLVALIGFSSFLSSITNMMMQLQQLKSERTRLQQTLCVYLKEHKISPQLSARVKKYAEADIIMGNRREAVFNAVSLLPRHLLVDLFEEARSPIFAKHIFLQNVAFLYPRMVRDICYLAADELVTDNQDIIFVVSDLCTSMLHVKSGTLKYYLERVSEAVAIRKDGSGTSDDVLKTRGGSISDRSSISFAPDLSIQSKMATGFGERGTAGQDILDRSRFSVKSSMLSSRASEIPMMPHSHVQKGQWISEAIMWTHWEYCGELHCVTPGELIALHAEKFGNVVRRYDYAVLQVAHYAQDFVENLNDSKQCTDVDGPSMEKKRRKNKGSAAPRVSGAQHDTVNVTQTVHSKEGWSVAKMFRELANKAMPPRH